MPSVGSSSQSLLIPEICLEVSEELLGGPGQDHLMKFRGDLILQTTEFQQLDLGGSGKFNGMDSSGKWMFLEPDAVLFSEWVTSSELQRAEKSPMFYKLNGPHPSALITLMFIVFSLVKSNVWMLLLLGDTAGSVHLYLNNFEGGSM